MRLGLAILSLITLCTFIQCDTSENVRPRSDTFVKLYGEQGSYIAVDLVQVPETSDFIILGERERPVSPSILLLRVDSLGNTIWSVELNDQDEFTAEIPVALDIDDFNNIYVVANFQRNDLRDVLIYKVDASSGSELDKLQYSVNEYGDCVSPNPNGTIDVASDIYVDSNNRILISGYVQSSTSGIEELFVTRFDSQLQPDPNWLIVLHPFFSGSLCENFDDASPFFRIQSQIAETNNEDIIVMVTSSNSDFDAPAGTNIEIFYLSNTGNVDFSGRSREFPGTDNNDEINAFTEANNGFAFVGSINEAASSSIIFGELNSLGNLTSEFQLTSRNLKAIDIDKNFNNNFIILAQEIRASDDANFYMTEIRRSDGSIVWEYAYGGTEIDEAAAMCAMDNSIYLLGSLNINAQNRILLMKTRSDGTL